MVRSLNAFKAAGVLPLFVLATLATACGSEKGADAGDDSTGEAESAVTSVPLWTAHYGYVAGGWRIDKNPRLVGDVNGDGYPDVVGFGNDGTYVSLSTGAGLADPALWLSSYGYDHGAGDWRTNRDLRFLTDVDGDGFADIVGLGDDGVYVSRSTGTAFSPPAVWLAHQFGYNPGAGDWNLTRTLRTLVDVNGDGLPDIVGFGNRDVTVALGTGSAFAAPTAWLTSAFGYGVGAGQWRMDRHLRYVADVNGDGFRDLVGFGNDGVYVALSTGTAFSTPVRWLTDWFGADKRAGGWLVGPNPRYLADVDGDGRLDIVGFGNAAVFVALNTGTAFAKPAPWLANFGPRWGYQTDNNPRMLFDMDGDGRADIVGFDNEGPYLSLSTGTAFAKPAMLVNNFGYYQGWRADRHLRLMADMNHDGKLDIVGFGDDGVLVWTR